MCQLRICLLRRSSGAAGWRGGWRRSSPCRWLRRCVNCGYAYCGGLAGPQDGGALLVGDCGDVSTADMPTADGSQGGGAGEGRCSPCRWLRRCVNCGYAYCGGLAGPQGGGAGECWVLSGWMGAYGWPCVGPGIILLCFLKQRNESVYMRDGLRYCAGPQCCWVGNAFMQTRSILGLSVLMLILYKTRPS
jgi:hypothetical protein